MFKVYGIYSNKDAFFIETFFIKIGKVITWIKSDIELNARPYYSNEQVNALMGQSIFAQTFSQMKEGESFDIQYGSCSNHYRMVKMTSKEIATLTKLHNKNVEFEKMKTDIQKNKNAVVKQNFKAMTKATKNLQIQTI